MIIDELPHQCNVIASFSVAVVVRGRTVNGFKDVGWALPTITHVGQCPTYGLLIEVPLSQRHYDH